MSTDNEAILLKDEENEEIKPIIAEVREKNIVFRAGKRIIDIIAGTVGVILLIPITALVFLINIFAGEGTSIFYNHTRIGKNGKQFKMYKFRTMCKDADKILEKRLKEDENFKKEFDKYKKIKGDKRITKCGEFLRKTSLDEFPQFINVLKGQMSLIGPRPYLPREKKDMGRHYYNITKVKPGLTGPWQVSGRSNLKFEDRLKLDEEYINTMSIKKDIKLLLKTVSKVIKKDGAI